ncbi:MAG: MotA/TolQ/ExbB proton channel family protein [Candidatus Goldiibacteriota bacterium HGW-Goldbacteria-1]|jgi:biopolymer transport protein ExbB|nr:MAG: MotA/TolQ/ExbB proton channel family protein [Candidatus Goldiibacteriota bacterium HGW-Goldbacteria-1]
MKRSLTLVLTFVLSVFFAGALFAAEGGEAGGYQIDTLQVLRSSWVIILMLVLSIVVVGVTVERFMYFQKNKLDSDKFMAKIKGYIVDKKFEEAEEFCKNTKGNVPKVILEGLENRFLPREEVSKLMEVAHMEQKINMERYLGVLGTLGNISPFIGLLGTVLGIIKAFKDLASSAGGGPEVVMVGIAEALIATAAGLAVAIPAVVMFNIYTKRVKNIAVEMEAMAKKMLVLLANYAEGSNAGRRK